MPTGVKDNPLKASQYSLWIQPDGPNTAPQYLGCHTVGDIAIPHGDRSSIYCPDENRSGKYKKVGSYAGEPGEITGAIETLLAAQEDWLEEVAERDCPVPIHIHKVTRGKRNIFTNRDRSFQLYPLSVVTENYVKLGAGKPGDNEESGYNWDYAADNIWREYGLNFSLQSNLEVSAFNDIVFCNAEECASEDGPRKDICEDGIAVTDAPAGSPNQPADVWETGNNGADWDFTATHPFAVGEDLISVTCFLVGRDTTRWLVAREADGANPMEVAYSDDGGATWTLVVVGTAAGLGANRQGALFALDMYHIWLVLDSGYIYFSSDGALTWTAQEEGLVTAQDLNAVHFESNGENGIAVGDSDAVLVTTDGGENWSAGTATGGGGDLYCCAQNDNGGIWWVGDSAGDLYYSNDHGVTWTQRAFSGDGTGEVVDIQFVSPLHGFMIHNTAASLGRIFKTIDGGYTWENQTKVPTNSGLNALWVCSINEVFAVGEAHGGNGVILQGSN